MILIQIVSLIVLLAFSAFFSSAESAFFTLNPLQLRRMDQSHPTAARRVHMILSDPNRFLATILIGNTVVNVLVSIIGLRLSLAFFPVHAEWIAVIGMTLLLLIFGEIGPKRLALIWPEQFSATYALPLSATIRALSPLRRALEMITKRFEPWFRTRGRTLSGEEFETVVTMSGEQGLLKKDERKMLQSILRLEDLQARDVMTPRVDLIGYDLNDDPHKLYTIALRAYVRHLVLYRDSIDRIEGVLDVRRYLLDPEHRVQPAWRNPLFVPEACPLDRLLTQFLQERRRVAIVVDEYGGTAGVVTRGDILEEIVGEIDDEHAEHKHVFDATGTDRWLLDGQISLEQINQELNLHLEAEGVDRMAGWIAAQLERLPRPGDTVTAQGCRAVVQQMRKHRVTLVQLERLPPPTEEDEPHWEEMDA